MGRRAGRPTDNAKADKITIRIDYQTRRFLEKQALSRDCSMSECARQMILEMIEQYKGR